MRHKFVVYGNPVPKERWRSGRRKAYTPDRTKTWQLIVAWAYKESGGPFLSGDVEISFKFYRANRRRADYDNLEKAITDALNGIAYEDDGQIVHWEGWKLYDKENPRVEIEIAEVKQDD